MSDTGHDEPPIEGLEIVVRGGLMENEPMTEARDAAVAESGQPLISVSVSALMEDETQDYAIARIIRTDRIPHGMINVGLVERLWAAGFDLLRAPPPPYHVNVNLSSADLEALDRFRSAFHRRIENPVDRDEIRSWKS